MPGGAGFPGCPPGDIARQAQLEFYSRRDTPLAVASISTSVAADAGVGECNAVSLTINGRSTELPLLDRWSSGSGLSRFPPLLPSLDTALHIKIADSTAPVVLRETAGAR